MLREPLLVEFETVSAWADLAMLESGRPFTGLIGQRRIAAGKLVDSPVDARLAETDHDGVMSRVGQISSSPRCSSPSS